MVVLRLLGYIRKLEPHRLSVNNRLSLLHTLHPCFSFDGTSYSSNLLVSTLLWTALSDLFDLLIAEYQNYLEAQQSEDYIKEVETLDTTLLPRVSDVLKDMAWAHGMSVIDI